MHAHLPPITQTIQVRGNVGHCWESKDEPISDVLLWTTTYGHTSVGLQAKTYIHKSIWMQPRGHAHKRWLIAERERERESRESVPSAQLGSDNGDNNISWSPVSMLNFQFKILNR